MSASEKQKQQWKEATRRYHEKHKDKINERKRKHYKKDLKPNSQWYSHKLKRNKKWRDENHEQVMTTRRNYEHKRYYNDPLFRLKRILRSRIGKAIAWAKTSKCKKSIELTGCSLESLRTHIESLWKEGMSWDNYGIEGWHIDHIRPISSFDLTQELDQKQCFHYTNLQPLWAVENIMKNDKWK